MPPPRPGPTELEAHPAWRHYVTVVIDLTGIRHGTGPARLLDGRGPLQASLQAVARRASEDVAPRR